MATARDYGLPDMVAVITVAAIASPDNNVKRAVLSVLKDSTIRIDGNLSVIGDARFFRTELERVAKLFNPNPLTVNYAPALFPNGDASVSIGEAIDNAKRQLESAFDKVFHALIILGIILLVAR
jgi:hypothetical protein